MKPQTINTFNDVLVYVNIIIYTCITIFGFFSSFLVAMGWGIQFHNIDLSYNMALIANDINNNNICKSSVDYRKWADEYELNQDISYTDAYITSSSLLRDLLLYGAMSVFVFGCGVTGMFFTSFALVDEKKRMREKKK